MDDSLIDDYLNSNEKIKNKNVMPQNLEAEQSLIGSILFDNKILEDLPINFSSNYFFNTLIFCKFHCLSPSYSSSNLVN